MNELLEWTFNVVKKHSHRDQLALPFVCFLLGYKPQGLVRNQNHNYLRFDTHSKTVNTKKVNVHHITPARSDKNFGKAINQLIEGLPDEDWICLRDIDTVPVYHEMFIKQCEEIANDPKGFDLVGSMTNRLGLDYQLVPGMFDEWDILKHREVAKELAKTKDIKPLFGLQTVGGLMMLFSKKTWLTVGKFPEGGIMLKGKFLDYHFSNSVGKAKLRMGIAQGIYLLHLYRMDAPNGETRKDINRLI